MITRPQQITKGIENAMTLDKSQVLPLAVQFIEDTYFHDVYNWKCVILNYVTAGRVQKETVVFENTSDNILTGEFLVSEHVRGDMLIESISIRDFDNGSKRINREHLVDFIEELDVIF